MNKEIQRRRDRQINKYIERGIGSGPPSQSWPRFVLHAQAQALSQVHEGPEQAHKSKRVGGIRALAHLLYTRRRGCKELCKSLHHCRPAAAFAQVGFGRCALFGGLPKAKNTVIYSVLCLFWKTYFPTCWKLRKYKCSARFRPKNIVNTVIFAPEGKKM